MSAGASSSAAQDKSGTPQAPPKPTEYRNPTVADDDDDDDDDDLDDLDDVLDSFNAPPKSTLGKRDAPDAGSTGASVATPGAGPSASAGPSAAAPAKGAGGDVVDDEFEASLIEGMESLLRSLAAENPPGPMADTKGGASSTGTAAGAADAAGKAAAPGMSSEEEEKAFQRAVQMMLSGEGLEAMGLDGKGKPTGAAGPSSAGQARSATPGKEQLNFEDTIKRTMESLNAGGAGAASARDEMPGDIAALLKQLSEDPSALDGLGDDDDELGGLLDGMMSQLMSKEVLEEPMGELAAKYPGYLEKPPAGVSKEDLEKYRKQHELVKQILDVFKRPGYTDDKDGKEVAKLVGEMQDLGGPPNEIMGDLPEGFDLGALGGDEGCVVM